LTAGVPRRVSCGGTSGGRVWEGEFEDNAPKQLGGGGSYFNDRAGTQKVSNARSAPTLPVQ
jgi:hypothetical protein